MISFVLVFCLLLESFPDLHWIIEVRVAIHYLSPAHQQLKLLSQARLGAVLLAERIDHHRMVHDECGIDTMNLDKRFH